MNYVFCGAYRQLFFALYLKNLGKKVKIVTYNKDIKKFCEQVGIKYIFFEMFSPKIEQFHKIPQLKNILDNLINKINFKHDDCFYLLGYVISVDGFYLAKELSKVGNVYYKNSEREFARFKFNVKTLTDKNIIKFLFKYGKLYMRFFYKIILDLDLVFYKMNRPIFGIDEKFFKKHNIREILPDKNYDQLISEVIKNSNVLEKNYDNLIVGQGLMKGIIKFDSMKELYGNILNMPFEFAFKKHPKPLGRIKKSEEEFYTLFKKCGEISRYIPVELTFNNISKNVISIASVALIPASKMKHLKAISLLELVDWHNESYKSKFKDYLRNASNDRILFPNNFEELKKRLLNSQK